MYEEQMTPKQVWALMKVKQEEADVAIARAKATAETAYASQRTTQSALDDLQSILIAHNPSIYKKYRDLNRYSPTYEEDLKKLKSTDKRKQNKV